MFLLQYGAERVPRSLSLRNGSPDLGWEPLYGVLLDTDDGWVLFDSGMGRDALDAEALCWDVAEVVELRGRTAPTQLARPINLVTADRANMSRR